MEDISESIVSAEDENGDHHAANGGVSRLRANESNLNKNSMIEVSDSANSQIGVSGKRQNTKSFM